jgi:hypothetical protein
MNTEALLAEVERVFPFVDKPDGLDLRFHKDDCAHCQFLAEDLEAFPGKELPPPALRNICNEMSCLSALGWRWALPSYLRHCLKVTDTYDDMETEFLIYSLGPAPEHQPDAIQCLSALNREQVHCLVHFLEWCSVHPHWSSYCSNNIPAAIHFVSGLRPN